MTIERIKELQKKVEELEKLHEKRVFLERMKICQRVTLYNTDSGDYVILNDEDSLYIAEKALERIIKRETELELWLDKQ